ncbi:MAG TPA: CRISPR-associated endonuclease Cas3'' [Candidatus Dormibacteraeota bacterium]|nr:CRISPR-associated endonuclease Cas3'' [Candidatus Dormibacteraeota bacterium]
MREGGSGPAGFADGSFDEFVQLAAGQSPYPYQQRLAEGGLPELLQIPTGAGKTLAATLPWLYRRRFHPDPEVRAGTPHWLIFVLPMRVLVEQTRDMIGQWLHNAGLADEVGLHVVMGGEGRLESAWRRAPEQDAIFVGTLDMLISRALNRGYAASRFAWPIDFGLFNSGCQWVFDEVQLMGPALPTSRQLEGLRRTLGTGVACRSMWMSATVDKRQLSTVDLPEVGAGLELGSEDWAGPLARRLNAPKIVRQLALESGATGYGRDLAAALRQHHRPGTRTIAILNTVERAREVWRELTKRRAAEDAEAVLLHSRFRAPDRATRAEDALRPIDPSGPGLVVVATQVLEAGVDISATTLFTEAAPWPSIVQRAGRCNRGGESSEAVLLWASPPSFQPYEANDVEHAASELISLEGATVTPGELIRRTVAVVESVHPVLRRRDLVGLFDTTSDLSGNDLDVGRYIREAGDLDVQVAWRSGLQASAPPAEARPTRDELCPVPIGQVRKWLTAPRGAGAPVVGWRFDPLGAEWVRCKAEDVRPGHVLLVPAEVGGYDPLSGWDPKSTVPVEVLRGEESSPIAQAEEATADDPCTFAPGAWVGLRDHLEQAERALRDIAAAYPLPPHLVEAAALAARLHDLGKVHPSFQAFLVRTVRSPDEAPPPGGPWAKSAGSGRAVHERRFFRHELASALALLANPQTLQGIPDSDLVVYLVAAHHGRVRLAIRSQPGEMRPDGDPDRRVALGIWDGEPLPATDIPGGSFPSVSLSLAPMELGDDPDGAQSWTSRMMALRDRPDIGPFRLGFLEALVRLADWRVSSDDHAGHP